MSNKFKNCLPYIKNPTKVAKPIINKIMAEEIIKSPTKMLFFLNSANPIHRILRRGIIIGFLTFLAIIFKEFITNAPEIYIPIFTAILAIIDKIIGEYTNLR